MNIINKDKYVIVDDWLDSDWNKKCLLEVEKLAPFTKTGTSDINGDPNDGYALAHLLNLDSYYKQDTDSSILTIFKMFFWGRDLGKILEDKHTNPVFSILKHTTVDRTALQIYGDKGFYHEHKDDIYRGEAIIANYLLCREPKMFTGGELTIGDDIVIEHKNNRLILFPAFLPHSVREVHLNSDDIMNGRISLQHRGGW